MWLKFANQICPFFVDSRLHDLGQLISRPYYTLEHACSYPPPLQSKQAAGPGGERDIDRGAEPAADEVVHQRDPHRPRIRRHHPHHNLHSGMREREKQYSIRKWIAWAVLLGTDMMGGIR